MLFLCCSVVNRVLPLIECSSTSEISLSCRGHRFEHIVGCDVLLSRPAILSVQSDYGEYNSP